MQFEIDRERLLGPLQAVIGVVERRQTMPVLGHVLVVAREGEGLTLTASDLEVELQAGVECEVLEGGQITLPARKAADIVRNLPEGARLRLQVDQQRVVLRSGRSRFSLATLPAADFPGMEEIGEPQTVGLTQAGLRWLLEKTHFSMAIQDVRYYLNGLLLEIEPVGIRAVATDGHRLALASLAAETGVQEPRQVIVPRKGVQEMLRLLEASEEAVELALGGNHVRISLPRLRFTSKLIDGRFPEYGRVIPDGSGTRMDVDRETLRQALVRASILSNEKYRGVRFVVERDRLRIQSHNPEQEEAEEEVPVSFAGEGLEVGFNASYMLDVLAAISAGTVHVYLTDGNSSALVQGEGEEGARFVVMPMRL